MFFFLVADILSAASELPAWISNIACLSTFLALYAWLGRRGMYRLPLNYSLCVLAIMYGKYLNKIAQLHGYAHH
jgi:hypothetical protein